MVEKAVDEVIAQMDSEQIAVSAAAAIADETPERQREIAAMPPTEQREAVRKLRRKDLPTPAEAHRRAKRLALTPKGRTLIETGIEARSRWVEGLTDALTPEQQSLTISVLTLLTEAARANTE